MSRTILVGDVHGCRDELDTLLSYVGLTSSDRLVLAGDLVVRGPDPHGVIALCRRVGARAVLGNHEARLLAWTRHLSPGDDSASDPHISALSARLQHAAPGMVRIAQATLKTAKSLTSKDWAYIRALPTFLRLPEHQLAVVHAGVDPRLPLEQQTPQTLLHVRSLGADGEPCERRGERSWAYSYAGAEHIVFGHNAMLAPEVAPCATGLDTGAVYGGRLTAMILRENEGVPPAKDRQDVLVSIPARRSYVDRIRAA